MRADYVVVGASHAALAAVHALRMHDQDGTVAMLTRESELPYSPTILPYVVSGRSHPERIFLRDETYFHRAAIRYLPGVHVKQVLPERSVVRCADGREIGYGKLLIATGARPVVPRLPGLERVHAHVLRTLPDALALRDAAGTARSALVIGAGLVGMHAAENLVQAGLAVTVIESESHVLPGYFDKRAASIIAAAFRAHGVRIATRTRVAALAPALAGVEATLDSGEVVRADLVIAAAGVAAGVDLVAGSGIVVDRGIVVDDTMQSSVANVWAAGDVAQARSFYDAKTVLNGILPDAVLQGRIAGMAMAGDPGLHPYPGAVPVNTYVFFGQHAVSVGIQGADRPGVEVIESCDVARGRYLRIVLAGDRLLGMFGINVELDPGILKELVLRRTDLAPVRARFIANPRDTARTLMSQGWR